MHTKQKRTANRITAREKNQRAFQRLRARYERTHNGQWIGLVDGKVVATAKTYEELHNQLVVIEPRTARTMVFQAGASWAQHKKIIILPFV